jgi:DNA invertase Pin-like site-specific DNA recombinase
VSAVIGYLRVSTADQDYGIGVQRALIEAEAGRRGWESIEWIVDHGKTAKKIKRPGLDRARDMLSRGEAELLVVSKLDRLSRSVADFTHLIREAMYPTRGRKPWSMVVLDPGIDLTTPNGRLVANILMSVAEWEGEIISDRTRAALGQAKRNGVKLGASVRMDPAVDARIAELRASGLSFAKIAATLNAEGATPPSGSKFHPSTIDAVLRRVSR